MKKHTATITINHTFKPQKPDTENEGHVAICEKPPHRKKKTEEIVGFESALCFPHGTDLSARIPPEIKEPQPYNWYNDATLLTTKPSAPPSCPTAFQQGENELKAHVLASADCKPNHHAVTPISKHDWHLLFSQLKGKKAKLFNRMV